MIDCTKLHGRLREICEHRSGLPRDVEDQYIAMWEGQAPPKPQTFDCIYRGGEVGRVLCPSCDNKTVWLKIFACPLHANCVVRREDVGKIRGCGGCGSRMEKSPEVT